MKHVVWVLWTLLVAAEGTAGETGPSSFRCKNDLVQIGDSKVSAMQKCGVPVARDKFCKPGGPVPANADGTRTTVIVNSACETVEELTFNPGYGQFMTTLRFESGKLVSISYGDRVK
jgi:hypothetical protein